MHDIPALRDDGRIVAPGRYMDADIKEEFTAVRGDLQNVSERVHEVDVRVREVDTRLSTEIRRMESTLRQEIREEGLPRAGTLMSSLGDCAPTSAPLPKASSRSTRKSRGCASPDRRSAD
jgi:hypothetical protein